MLINSGRGIGPAEQLGFCVWDSQQSDERGAVASGLDVNVRLGFGKTGPAYASAIPL
jgi:hypothetical protein